MILVYDANKAIQNQKNMLPTHMKITNSVVPNFTLHAWRDIG